MVQTLDAGANLTLEGFSGKVFVTYDLDRQLDIQLVAFLLNDQGKVLDDHHALYGQQADRDFGIATIKWPVDSSLTRRHQIDFDLSNAPTGVTRFSIALTENQQIGFASLKHLKAEIYVGSQVITLSPNAFSTEQGIIVFELYLRNAQPKIKAIWQGFSTGLKGLCQFYGAEFSHHSPTPTPTPTPIASVSESTSKPIVQLDVSRQRLINLLEYISQQAFETDINKMTISQPNITPKTIADLPGVKLGTIIDDDIWLEVSRLHPVTPPVLPDQDYSQFIKVNALPDQEPKLDLERFKTYFKERYIQPIENVVQDGIAPLQSDGNFIAIAQQKELAYQQSLEKLESLYQAYIVQWKVWSETELPRRKSIRIYDLLFSWRMSITASTGTPQELVVGLGLIGWKLPTTGHAYLYPLMTQPLEISSSVSGVLQIRPRDTAPQLEFDAFLAQESLSHTGELRQNLRKELSDGRQVSIFDPESYIDVVQTAVYGLSSQGTFNETDLDPSIQDFPEATCGWRFFMRSRTGTILQEDVEKLQEQLKLGYEIPAQPLSLVTPPSTDARSHEPVTFRGRGGVEGSGSKTQELYFPLAYNREQITIIDQLSKNCGVVVQGPPGTGKTHTIANIICHYLALGKRVLVTAEKGHVLKTVQEKIPETVRPLVVSRVGSEQEGRKQLEYSIDSILQQLTQINPTQVEEDIQLAHRNIDRIHDQMGLIDRKINDIALVHYSDIEVDGNKQRAHQIADLVLNGESRFQWFDDVLNLEEKYAPPLTLDEADQVRTARRQVGQHLSDLYTRLPNSQQLPNLQAFIELHELLQKNQQLEQAQLSGTLWTLREPLGTAIPLLRHLQSRIAPILSHAKRLEAHLEDFPWTVQLRHHLSKNILRTEREAFERLLPDLQRLIEARAGLISRPVAVPSGLMLQPKALEAIARGAETGEPFNWYSFGVAEIKNLLSQIKVSGLPAVSADDWQWVQSYLQLQQQIESVFTRWNQFAPELSLPILNLDQQDSLLALKTIDLIYGQVEIVLKMVNEFDGTLISAVSELFVGEREDNAFDHVLGLMALTQQLDDHLVRAELTHAIVRWKALQQHMTAYDGVLTEQLLALINTLGRDRTSEMMAADYLRISQNITQLERLEPFFEQIRTAVRQFEDAGALQFASRLKTIAASSLGEDPALPTTWRDAWVWARLKTFLDEINQRDELVRLSGERASLEKNLAKFYEQVSTKQAWLSLKRSASDKVMTALNRYKTAIQKIGKGTGKNASRYRKDAQVAMLDAAEAIPCWVMTHQQVSESMPAHLGMFDLIIIDEASQSTIDVLPVLLRGQKLLVVGDDKQVSPSNVGLSSDRIDLLRNKYLQDQPHASIMTPNMSLYDMASSIYASNVMLLEHFRCHPAIIGYSNRTFYANKIRPMRISKVSERLDPPLISIYVPEGVRSKSKSSDINKAEAEAIVAEIEVLLRDPHYTNRTIGVISLLGPVQAEYIQKLAFDQIGQAELSKCDFVCGDASAFQGSERDIMFLSMVATPESCHPLTRRDHEQRFNVAASRARERMYLVHSVKAEHLSDKDLRVALLGYYSNPLDKHSSTLEDRLKVCESGFEREVLSALDQLGYAVLPQVKAGGFRLDMVVEGDGDSRLAIECDGDSFHGPEQWPADMARQRALERAGWTFWRCFASTWKLDQDGIMQDLVETLTKMGIQPRAGQHAHGDQVESRVWIRSEENVSIDDVSDDIDVEPA